MHASIGFPTGQQIMKFRGAMLATDDPELYAYRAYAHLIYDQLPLISAHNGSILSQSLWSAVSMRDVHVPTIDVGNGVMLYDVRDFIIEYPTLAHKYLFDAPTDVWRDRKICALIEGYWNVGTVLFVPPAVRIDLAIDIRALLAPYSDTLLIEKCMVIVESNASVTFIDRVDTSSIDARLILRAIDYKIGEYASVNIYASSRLDVSVYECVRHTIHAREKSQVTFSIFMTGSAHSTVWLDCFLQGRGASINVRGAGALGAQRHINMITRQHHAVVDTHSDLLIKNCLGGSSTFDYTGSIYVAPKAAKTSALQRNTNLLISQGARARSVPSLEVLNNDVQCSHGSAVGQLDTEQLFYAQSRGLSADQAQKLLIEGFLAEVLMSPVEGSDSMLAQEAAAYILEDE